MKSQILKAVLSLICICSFSSCATMTTAEKNKRMYTVRIDSKTKGLPVYYTEQGVEHLAGVTPCDIYSDKAKIKYVTVKKGDIYQTVTLKTKLKTGTLATRLLGPVEGMVYSQKEYYVDL